MIMFTRRSQCFIFVDRYRHSNETVLTSTIYDLKNQLESMERELRQYPHRRHLVIRIRNTRNEIEKLSKQV